MFECDDDGDEATITTTAAEGVGSRVAVLDLDDEVRSRAAVTELSALLTSGFTDEQARYEMGISFEDYDRVKRMLYERETHRLRKATAHEVFIDYSHGQQAVLKSVDAIMTKMEDSKQFSAAVGALRLASDIRERIIRVGQDLGVLEKRPDEKRSFVITGTVEEMRAAVAKEVREIDGMMKKHEGGAGILEMEAGPLHRPLPALSPPSTTGRGRAHHGRRVVKEGLKPA